MDFDKKFEDGLEDYFIEFVERIENRLSQIDETTLGSVDPSVPERLNQFLVHSQWRTMKDKNHKDKNEKTPSL